jgi:hypothetical protein
VLPMRRIRQQTSSEPIASVPKPTSRRIRQQTMVESNSEPEPRRIALARSSDLADPEWSTIRVRRDVADLVRRIQGIEGLATPTDALVLLAYGYLQSHPVERQVVERSYRIEKPSSR